MADSDTPFGQKTLHIPQAQAETEAQPNGVLDDFGRKTVAFEARGVLAICHDRCLEMR